MSRSAVIATLMLTRRHLPRLLGVLAAMSLAASLGSCASRPQQLGFTTVKDYRLKEDDRRAESMSIDPMLRFERQHLLHGAVTLEEKRDRYGNYFTFFWNGDPRGGPVTLRFEYRQSRTGERVFRHEQVLRDVRWRNLTSIRVTGEAYQRYGHVIAWRATLIQGECVIGVQRSFLWE